MQSKKSKAERWPQGSMTNGHTANFLKYLWIILYQPQTVIQYLNTHTCVFATITSSLQTINLKIFQNMVDTTKRQRNAPSEP